MKNTFKVSSAAAARRFSLPFGKLVDDLFMPIVDFPGLLKNGAGDFPACLKMVSNFSHKIYINLHLKAFSKQWQG